MQEDVGKCATSATIAGMPSRVLSPSTREDETSPTSTSPSFQSASPGLNPDEFSPEQAVQNKSGTQRRRSQSFAPELTNHSSSTAVAYRHSEYSPSSTLVDSSPGSNPQRAQRPSSSPSPLRALAAPPTPSSYVVRQPRASGLNARSSSVRRAPASCSSHGIETLSGPPPALITQRSYTGDDSRRYTQPADPNDIIHQAPNGNFHVATRDPPTSITTESSDKATLERSKKTNKEMASTRTASDEFTVEENQDELTLRGVDFRNSRASEASYQAGNESLEPQSQSPHDDLFLNLARADTAAQKEPDSSHRNQRRRSRLSLSSTQPTSSHQPSSTRQSEPMGRALPHQRPSSKREPDSPSWQETHVSRQTSPDSKSDGNRIQRSYAASAHSVDHRVRAPYSSLAPKASLKASRARRSSIRDPSPELPSFHSGRLYKAEYSPEPPTSFFQQPSVLHTTPNQYNSSPLHSHSLHGQRQAGRRSSRADGTESTISTNAPSMILEQLDDLNSRIKKLELNGKMPSTSSAAMSSILGERPATATTAMTTMSPSPKHGQVGSNSPEASTITGPTNPNVRPLLYQALARCKDIVSVEAFRALEATASDAITLASMTSSADADQNIASSDDTLQRNDQRLRHKANSMCRGLTELCIALSDVRNGTQISNAKSPPETIDTATAGQPSRVLTIEPSRSSRSASLERESRTSSRVMSRLEARRTSQVALNAQIGRRESSPFEPPPLAQAATVSRASSVLLRRRNEEGELPTSRSLVVTESGQSYDHPSPSGRISREYTSQHPLPIYPKRSPSVQSSLPQRKSYFLNGSSTSPTTPSQQPRDRRYLDLSTPPSSGSSRLAEMRQKREASQGLSGGLGGSGRAGLLNIRAGPADIRRIP